MVKKFVPTTIISLVMVLLGSQQSRAQDLYFPPSEAGKLYPMRKLVLINNDSRRCWTLLKQTIPAAW